jgi:hypothetical protein
MDTRGTPPTVARQGSCATCRRSVGLVCQGSVELFGAARGKSTGRIDARARLIAP